MKQNVIIAIIVVLVVAAGIFVYTQRGDSEENNTNQTNNMPQEGDIVGEVPGDPDEDPQTPTTDTIAVSTQIAGSTVTIDNVFLSKPGFIDIHEATSTGELGKSVGVSGYLGVGAKQDLTINATIVAGAKYFAVVHVDDGNKIYNSPGDAAATMNGLPVQALFSVSQ